MSQTLYSSSFFVASSRIVIYYNKLALVALRRPDIGVSKSQRAGYSDDLSYKSEDRIVTNNEFCWKEILLADLHADTDQ